MPEMQYEGQHEWKKVCPRCMNEFKIQANSYAEAQTSFFEFFTYNRRSKTADELSSYCRDCNNHKANGRIFSPYSKRDMLREQNNSCYLCLEQFEAMRFVYMDHDHITGKNRRLLCNRCNVKMAGVDDNEWLTKAIAYRDSHR